MTVLIKHFGVDVSSDQLDLDFEPRYNTPPSVTASQPSSTEMQMFEHATLEDPCGVLVSMPKDRRNHDRLPINCRILLTPIDERDSILVDDNVTTFGEDVSQGRSGGAAIHA
jgi:hypothetical protein